MRTWGVKAVARSFPTSAKFLHVQRKRKENNKNYDMSDVYTMQNATTWYHTLDMLGTGKNLHTLRVVQRPTPASIAHLNRVSPSYLHLYQYTALVAALASSELAPC